MGKHHGKNQDSNNWIPSATCHTTSAAVESDRELSCQQHSKTTSFVNRVSRGIIINICGICLKPI